MDKWEHNGARWGHISESCWSGHVRQPGFGLYTSATNGNEIFTTCCTSDLPLLFNVLPHFLKFKCNYTFRSELLLNIIKMVIKV